MAERHARGAPVTVDGVGTPGTCGPSDSDHRRQLVSKEDQSVASGTKRTGRPGIQDF